MSTHLGNPTTQERVDPLRRDLLAAFSILLGSVAAAMVAVPLIGFLFTPLILKSPSVWRSVGGSSDFHVGETVEVTFEDSSPLAWAGVSARTAAWLRRASENEFIAFSVNCTHLGCPVRWLPDADLFMCPCHGGVYYADGKVAAGPPPHALVRYPVRVENGFVQIQTSGIPTV